MRAQVGNPMGLAACGERAKTPVAIANLTASVGSTVDKTGAPP